MNKEELVGHMKQPPVKDIVAAYKKQNRNPEKIEAKEKELKAKAK